MKVWILTRKKISTVCFCAAVGVLSVLLAFQGTAAFQAVSAKRQVPIYCVKTEEKKIAISFDAAWGNEDTQNLIDILNRYNVKTTFFVVGAWVDKYPESVRALNAAGHEVCNHSNSHPHLPKLPREKIAAELNECNEKIKKITGKTPLLFRPPYGDYDNALLETAKSCGLVSIQWDVDSLDWKNPTPKQIASRVISQVKTGSIVLFHNGAVNTPTALPTVLETLKSNGYEIVPVSQLIYREGYTIDRAGTQIKD